MTKRKVNPQRGGRKPSGHVRHTVSLPPALWQFVDVQGGKNRSERLEVALESAVECQGWEQPPATPSPS